MGIKLSIIIPIYKEDDFIEECLNSIYNEINNCKEPKDQYEVIVVSDGASDSAIDKIMKFEKVFINFKLIKMEHRGAAAARNLGIKETNGEYIAFVDADDMMSKGFLSASSELLDRKKDLYIFGLKRIEGEKVEFWTVKDREYNLISEFADEYIRNGHLLIYSNCNKLYRRKIINDYNIKYDESIHFGEDRIFNYEYLRYCNSILTSSIIKHDYIKRSEISQSTKHYDNYFNIALKLHKEKVRCFIDLSKDASDEDIKNFIYGDLIKEIEKTFERFIIHKDEEQENIKLINDLLFEKPDDMSDDIGIFIILGSNNCGYKVIKALDLCKDKPYINFIVTGGNKHLDEDATESEFMAKNLETNDVPKDNIYIENDAHNTIENFKYSYQIIKRIEKNKNLENHNKIGVLTSAFHLKRTKLIAKKYFNEYFDNILFFSAFGPTVTLDGWYKNEQSKNIVFNEIRKNINEYPKSYV